MEDIASALQARLHHVLAADTGAAETADRAVSLWQEIVAAFAPIIGPRGSTALLRRAMSQTVPQHSWLSVALTGPLAAQDLAGLRSALVQRTAADIIAANESLLRNFFELLADLIGAALTERLLREALGHPASGIAPQETST
jgi:hypothetical protein